MSKQRGIERSRSEAMIAGVCAGIARHFQIENRVTNHNRSIRRGTGFINNFFKH